MTAAAPTTVAQFRYGTQHTAALLVAADENIDRFRSEPSFARLCATTPIPAPSDHTIRHRINNTGNQNTNHALHMIAIVQLPYYKKTKNYREQRTAKNLTKKEVIRHHKRYIAQQLFRTLRTNLNTLKLHTWHL